ncbi:hypothetical protein GCM10009785_34800 [Brooklawnia cerclae]|uniref:Phage tail protein n=1 Tax=Brooklawnia cerclae TaxID=349934 RepID=A0ABX0SKK3_9ACTN|nr:hypothetical protein [Brooklawnia cerclae]NIH58469.1 hypothetical protein [Brooklawnia cerclae]
MSVNLYDYRPAASLTAGNTLIGIASAVADIDAMTIAEANSSVMVQGATDAFSATTDVANQSRKMIGDKVASSKPGTRTYNMGDLTIMLGDPQAATNEVLDLLELDAELVFWIRPGLQADADSVAAVASGQKYVAIRAIVAAVDLRDISTSDGDEFAIVLKVSVVERTQLFGTIAAA